ncbi:DUF664 domain-containing protein [Dactylosporangium sp. CA-139066]|uniref:mycothiol transferase n=1 Tax=Dactylosporangium sp. CA-139066 TaxID=3239930 RepID=UPI003D92D5D6
MYDDAPWRLLARDLVERIEHDVLAVLDGIDPLLLNVSAEPGTNGIGWLVWHLSRSHDRNGSELLGVAQLWIAENWHTRFGRAADPDETGYRHTPAEMAAFRSPAPSVLAGYHRAVTARLLSIVDNAPDLSAPAFSPTLGDTATARARLAGVLVEGLEHAGQAALLRGVLERR